MLISAQSEFTNVIDATPFGGWLAKCEPWEWDWEAGREKPVWSALPHLTPYFPRPTPIQSANGRTRNQEQEKNGQGAFPRHSQRCRRDHLAFAPAARHRHPAAARQPALQHRPAVSLEAALRQRAGEGARRTAAEAGVGKRRRRA